jgi:phospholipase/lecithinase/hemolysin
MGLATNVTLGFNGGLDAALSALSALPGIQIVKLDVYAQLKALVANPAAFGLTNVQSACIQPGAAPFQCQNVDEYLFWDSIHPTAAAHAIIAQQAASALGR